ncbi:MAG: hypothetical protein IT479_14020 [Xanthomonadales bacterium]|nr:hypothetical protein [Xanthomonadales bacterium]
MRTLLHAALLAATLGLAGPAAAALPFTYQGLLEQSGTPYSGNANFEFRLYDQPAGGVQHGNTVSLPNWPVQQGLLSADLDFGSNASVPGSFSRWIEVRVNGTPLVPRQSVMPAPLAESALALAGRGVAGFAPVVGQVLTWSGTAWQPENPGAGQSYNAGLGLTLTGNTFAVNFAGSGGLNTAARSDHSHYGAQWGGNSGVAGLTVYNSHGNTESHAIFGGYSGNGTRGIGVRGQSAAADGIGVQGTGDGNGVKGVSSSIGVSGLGISAGSIGVAGDGGTGVRASGSDYGLYASSAEIASYGESSAFDGIGVYARNTASSGPAIALYARSASPEATVVVVEASSTGGSQRGIDASAQAPLGIALHAQNFAASGAARAARFLSSAPAATVVEAHASGSGNAWGVYARSDGSNGAAFEAFATGSSGRGLRATANGDSGVAVEASASGVSARAGLFNGNVQVTGTLSKGGGSFQIDHPLDPENKYLYHSFVESPDMMNLYNGNLTTDSEGYASVQLPDWFEALNRDFRYQLTVIGSFARAMVAEEVKGNRFAIRTDAPHVKVSWLVTGVRQDAWAERNRIPVEQDKADADKGRYLHPQAHGQPADKSIAAGRTAAAKAE